MLFTYLETILPTMKTSVAILLFNLFALTAFSQAIVYEPTFNAALAKASALQKPVFLLIDVPLYSKTFKSGLELPDVAAKYNESFVCYKVFITDTAYGKLRAKYASNIMPA